MNRIKEIISNHKSKDSDIFGNLINNADEFKNQVEEQETYEVIIGFWLFGCYYEFLNPNSEHKRILQVILPDLVSVLVLSECFDIKFYRYTEHEKFDGLVFSACIPNIMDKLRKNSNVTFEIGRITI